MNPMTNRVSGLIGTAGHVDHGKTSLIKALTGIDTDRLAEEKLRGLSIELGFAYIDFDGKGGRAGGEGVRAAVVDVPGHERFIKNMLAGITGVDMVLFVVAADDGIMAQSREHLGIVRLLGVKSAIFVITKCDLVDARRISRVEAQVRELLEGTALKASPVVRVSTVTGVGIPELKGLIRERLVERRGPGQGFFRLPVDRSFPIKGFGTVVTGTVASGSIRKGDTLVFYPGDSEVKVRGLESLYMSVDEISAGERAAVNISGVAYRDCKRGSMLVSLELKRFADLVKGDRRLRVDCFFDLPGAVGSTRRSEPVKNNSTLKLHHMTGETLVRIRFADKKEAAEPLAPGGAGRVFGRLFLEKPLLMLRSDRFILRDPATNTTVGGGIVHLPYPSRDNMGGVGRITVPKDGGIYETVKGLVGGNGLGFFAPALGVMLNLRQAEMAGRFGEEAGIKREFRITGDFVVNLKRAGALKREIVEALADFHAKDPLAPGMKEEQLFNKLAASISVGMGEKKALFKIVLEELIGERGERGERSVLRDGAVIRISSHRPVSKGDDAAVEGAMLKLFSGTSPVSAEAVGKLPFKKADIRRVMGYLEQSGTVVRLREGTYISGEAVQRARDKLMDHMRSSACIKASEFRDLLGCGRKLAIEILEYFDKSRVTLRKGDVRTLR